ncbi:MAG TPA: DUF222 domain-containing protein [Propionicimonas sp.]|nr:DUF222 domain-containing protein [Propionicimonas sp.]
MQHSNGLIPAGEALARIEAALDSLDPHRSDAPPDDRLRWVSTARRLRGRLDALTGLLTAEAEKAQAAERATGTPMVTWLGTTEVISRKEATRDLFAARNLGQRRQVGEAASTGRISSGQAQAIGRVLDGIGPQLDATQKVEAERLMVGMAATMDAGQLGKAAPQVLRQVVPAEAEELLEVRLQRQAEAAHRSRSLRFFTDEGSLRFEGSLPLAEGERFVAAINAHREKLRRTAIERRDPLDDAPTPDQRRADALIALLDSVGKSAPVAGAGTPRVLVTLSYDRLQARAAGAGIIADGESLSAGELRRLCCDADLIPAVLGSESEVLDVGRQYRLVTRPLRDALVLRDGGCAFPGCDVRPDSCEAHHITPWWDEGRTEISNLVLLCHHHHGYLEPAKHGIRDQWRVRINATTGLPEFTPPARFQRFAALRSRNGPPDGDVVPSRRVCDCESPPLIATG